MEPYRVQTAASIQPPALLPSGPTFLQARRSPRCQRLWQRWRALSCSAACAAQLGLKSDGLFKPTRKNSSPALKTDQLPTIHEALVGMAIFPRRTSGIGSTKVTFSCGISISKYGWISLASSKEQSSLAAKNVKKKNRSQWNTLRNQLHAYQTTKWMEIDEEATIWNVPAPPGSMHYTNIHQPTTNMIKVTPATRRTDKSNIQRNKTHTTASQHPNLCSPSRPPNQPFPARSPEPWSIGP